jgi:hypothetical protein
MTNIELSQAYDKTKAKLKKMSHAGKQALAAAHFLLS